MPTQVGDIVTPIPFYTGSGTTKRIADAMDGKFSIDTGQDMLIADGGVAYSHGRITCSMDINTMVPRAGMVNDLLSLALGQKKVSTKMLVDGRFVTFTGVIKTADYSSNFADGKVTGSWKFIGSNVQQA